ncbi:uncharacterized protein LOC141702647 [Apium graveolens]|uniref:uncharacterized protein LOC141699919 n=1 Tax=Apium graveolens TaxID=4045 RepID=UPI003D7BD1C0
MELLNGLNFKKWKQDIELNLGILDFDHVLKEDPPTKLNANTTRDAKNKYERWHKHIKMALICMKISKTNALQGGIPETIYARDYYNSIAEKYKSFAQSKVSNLMNSLTKMKFDGLGSMREYIMKGIEIIEN